MQSDVISRERFETQTTARQTAAADVEAAKAAAEQARLDLEFTEVRAPIRGRVGRDLVTVGNLISGGTSDSTLLTTVVSLDPIHVYFDADERAVLKYERLARSGERASSRDVPNPVLLALTDEQGFPHRGQMDFVDNQLDPRTGTMRGRAVFANPDLALTPGLFARVRLLGSGRHQALLLPDEAIGTDQSDRFVLVVDGQGRVESRIVEPGPLIEGLRVVRSGLAPEDRVVIRGLQSVESGSTVEPRAVEIAAPERFESLEALVPGAAAPVGAAPSRAAEHGLLPLLHRPADLRRGPLARDRDRRRHRLSHAAGGAVPGGRAAHDRGARELSRRERRGGGGHGGHAPRAGDQRGRGHALHVLAEHERRLARAHHHLRARNRSRHRPGARAEPRGGGGAAAARRSAAHRRHHAQELAGPADGRAPALARRPPRPALPQQLRAAADPRRARAPRRRRRRQRVRGARVQHARLAGSREDRGARADRRRRGGGAARAERAGGGRRDRRGAGPAGDGASSCR